MSQEFITITVCTIMSPLPLPTRMTLLITIHCMYNNVTITFTHSDYPINPYSSASQLHRIIVRPGLHPMITDYAINMMINLTPNSQNNIMNHRGNKPKTKFPTCILLSLVIYQYRNLLNFH